MRNPSNRTAGASETRLRGRWLSVVRGMWLLLAAGLLANWVASLFAHYDILRTLCTAPDAVACQFWQPTPDNARALEHLGLSLDAYAGYFLAIEIVVSLVFLAVAALIFWRKSDTWLGLFVSFVLLLFGSFGISDSLNGTFVTVQTPPIIVALLNVLVYIQWPCLGILLLTFPTGRFAPRWSWLLAFWWMARTTSGLWGPYNTDHWPGWLTALEVLATFGGTAAVQVYRYLRVYTPVQRQQTKWVVFGVAAGVTVVALYAVIAALVPGLAAADSPYRLLEGLVTAFLFVPLPLTLGVAILRFHLWDIDVLINRALVYGSLTAILALVYVVGVIGSQALVSGLTHVGDRQQSPLAIVVTTLIIAALFQPLRRRLQALIDRRFYRKKYDVEQTLAAFGATLRQEVELEPLRTQLVVVVEEAMQPTHVSLWMRQPERS
ncbi:MAG TPA: hypothetical protein VGP82_14290 [Ktedonobacterales bacterium]|jgi:hypothetical protein|nr:hypothetical protein [Ktedonobacterales bacterium]